jgi:hypothetical protein
LYLIRTIRQQQNINLILIMSTFRYIAFRFFLAGSVQLYSNYDHAIQPAWQDAHLPGSSSEIPEKNSPNSVMWRKTIWGNGPCSSRGAENNHT